MTGKVQVLHVDVPHPERGFVGICLEPARAEVISAMPQSVCCVPDTETSAPGMPGFFNQELISTAECR